MMKNHIYIVILLAASLGSCGNKYYEFSDAEEYMLPYEATDSLKYCDNVSCSYLNMSYYKRYVSDDSHMLPATNSFDKKIIHFKGDNNRVWWEQKIPEGLFQVEVSTTVAGVSSNFSYYHDSTRNQRYYEQLKICNKQYESVYELKETYNNDSKFYFNSTQGFLMLIRETDTIFFGETLNSGK